LPVTLLTGCDQDAEVSRGSELRADDYVVKPVSPTVLLNRIKRVLAAALPDAHRDETPDEDPGPKAPGSVRSFFRLGQGARAHEPEPALDALRTQYLENRVQELGVLAEALRRSDFPALRQAGHNLKGTGAAYGFAKLTEFGNALESAAKAEDGPEVELLLGKTKSYLSHIQTHAAH
jgi:HPt (histidine-containing phosphotransfer) domain-containing protein